MTISSPFNSFLDASAADESHQKKRAKLSSMDELHQHKRAKLTSATNNDVSLGATVIGDTTSSLTYLGWAWLPKHILDSVLDKLVALRDYLAFKTVCKSWYCVAEDNKRRRCIINSSHPQLPLLLIPVKESEERRLYNVTLNKIYDFRVKVPLFRCCGSSHGWLFILEETKSLTLLNPFSNKTINLPPITEGDEEFHDLFVFKAVLSKDPVLYPHDYEVAVIYGSTMRFAIYQVRTETWTYFPDHRGLRPLKDVIYYNGSFYVSDCYMGLGKVDSFGSPLQLSLLIPQSLYKRTKTTHNITETFLVETSNGDLLMVLRILYIEDFEWDPDYIRECEDIFTTRFRVFKIISQLSDDKRLDLEEINDFGNNAMFLGYNYSLLVSTFEFSGLQRNCIYYTNDRVDPHNPIDAGIFNLENGSKTSHYVPVYDRDLPPTNWIVPSLQGDW